MIEVKEAPACVHDTYTFACLTIGVAIIIISMIHISYLGIKGLLSWKLTHITTFFKFTFILNIIFTWLTIIVAYIAIIPLCYHFYINQKDMTPIWILEWISFGFWFMTFLSMGLNSLGRLYYTFYSTKYAFSLQFTIFAAFLYLCVLALEFVGLTYYYLSYNKDY